MTTPLPTVGRNIGRGHHQHQQPFELLHICLTDPSSASTSRLNANIGSPD
jgi:hypothetical protein